MSLIRGPVAVIGSILLALLLQTTLFGRFRIAGIAPDVVLVALLLVALRLRHEQVLLLAFTVGIVFDTISSTAIGLRALTYTSVVFLALRTRDRVDFSPLAVAGWIGALSLAAVIVFLLIGTLFSQVAIDGGEAMRRLLLVPLFNLVLGLMLTPLTARLLEPVRRLV